MSMIDMFLTSNKTMSNDVMVVTSVSGDSDHKLVMARLNIRQPKIKRRTKTCRYRLEKLKEEENVRKI